ncbi:MAG: hypothetical protein J2P21_26360 [Chloracidobacterium sp.]|nr:hypothetical protein [Chloracidobacterium sp.]
MKIDRSKNLIRRYLLGELEEEEQTALERELLIDRDKFDQAWAFENELVDSYARGEMSSADRERFEGAYLASPLHRERVAIAKSFLTSIDHAPGETVEASEKEPVVSWRRLFPLRLPLPVYGVILVISLLFTITMIWSHNERIQLTGRIANLQNVAQNERAIWKQRERELASRNQEFEKEIADVSRRNEQLKLELEQSRRRRPAVAPTVLSFLLTPAQVRGESAQPQSTFPLLAGNARFLMELNDTIHTNYQAIIQTIGGREILRRRTGKVTFGPGLKMPRAFTTLPVKAGELTKGDYILILFGQTADGKSEEIDRYFFRIS